MGDRVAEGPEARLMAELSQDADLDAAGYAEYEVDPEVDPEVAPEAPGQGGTAGREEGPSS